MMDDLVAALLVVAGFIHLVPLTGLLGHRRLLSLYGVDTPDPNLRILLQHRAVLFGMVGGLLMYAAYVADWRNVALGVGLTSAVSFLLIAVGVGGVNPAVRRVVIADIVAIAAMFAAFLLMQVRG